ncbi:MAG: hypothetical protein HETSPECPRED_007726 [Heterodermia speciosa]|uniref:Ubiquitinyl hydrolase 1 n=1 Tax=Heterodermia speciosa TaxID=116794 RepID=A0A8H3FUB1_9LECA|nr:MAG: hypothetical protein HETSPECPRED_007726 [Heterodermia speciosa]
MKTEEEMANLQRLSNDYVPEAQGDLVGHLRSTQAIAAEYSLADPVYVHKTTRLPEKYSHYRTVKGDGNCGWRGMEHGTAHSSLDIAEN